MTQEVKDTLKAAGREDLIEIHEINQAGYSGILSNGNIVDRRKRPDAIPVQENKMMGIPFPKRMDIKIFYKSGDGESFIEDVKVNVDGKWQLSDNACHEHFENEYSQIIFHHDHDRHIGYGSILIQQELVVGSVYQESLD